jgi:hypothetical protein
MKYQKLSRQKLFFIMLGIFMSSFSILGFQISLTRIFAVMLDYHYTFLVVSIALFGLGLGGITAQIFSCKASIDNKFKILTMLTATLSLSISIFVLIIASTQNLNIIALTIIMFLPFLISGTILATLYKMFVNHSSMLHFSDLLGAAIGAITAIFLLNLAGAIISVLIVGIVISIASLVFALVSKGKILIAIALLTITITGIFINYANGTETWNIQPVNNQEKEITYFLENPTIEAEIIDSRWTAFGQVDLLASPLMPHNKVIFTDGSAGTKMYHFDGNLYSENSVVQELWNSTQYFPYTIANKNRALIIGPGGGLDVLTAIKAEVDHIYAIEVNPGIVNLVQDYSDYNGGIYTNFENVHIYVDEGRSFLKRSDQKYDIIMLNIPITKTSQGTVGYALAENYLFTTEAFRDYLNHLEDDGYLTIVTHDIREVYKLAAITFKILGDQGLSTQNIMQQIAVIGIADQHGQSHNVLPVFMLKKTPITQAQALLINTKSQEIGVSTLFISNYSDSTSDPILMALSQEQISMDKLIDEIPFNMKAPTDDKPFFYNFKIGIPPTLSTIMYVTAGLTAVASLFYFIARRQQEIIFTDGTKKTLKSKFSFFKWHSFASLGLGFMLIEIAIIQQFMLYLGEPTIAIATSLFSLLLAGGLGSIFSNKWRYGNQHNAFKVCLIIAVLSIAYIFILPALFNATLNLSLILRFSLAFMFIFPLGFLMGIPFPTFLQSSKHESENDAAWMWCINGTFSMLAGVLAIVIAMTYGFSIVLILGAVIYGGIFIAGKKNKPKNKNVKAIHTNYIRW